MSPSALRGLTPMSPFDASAALLIGFVFGVAITALIADAYYEHKSARETEEGL
mgnify:FL=1